MYFQFAANFAATQIRLRKALPLQCSAFKHLIILHGILIITWLMFGKSLLRTIFYWDKYQFGINAITHILQKQRVLLLACLSIVYINWFHTGIYHCSHFISPDGSPLNGIKHFNLRHLPTHGIAFEKYSLKDSTCCRWCNDIVAHFVLLSVPGELKQAQSPHISKQYSLSVYSILFITFVILL